MAPKISEDGEMSIAFSTVLVMVALGASVLLVLERGDKLIPSVAAVIAAVQALMVFGVLTLALGRFRIEVILPAALVIAGGLCWARASRKGETTAATLLTMAAVTQLALALGLLR
jgi:hypothetical protein